MEKNESNFVKESSVAYSNLINIAEKTGYDKKKLQVLTVKGKIYEAYFNILQDDWQSAKDNIKIANNYLKGVENLDNKVNVIFKNLLRASDDKDKRIFLIKYSDAVDELNYLSL